MNSFFAETADDGRFPPSSEEAKKQLFLRQKRTLDTFLQHGAISQAQHDKSLHDLIEKMGVTETGDARV